MDTGWSLEHSEECPVPVSFAWAYWTEVSNWRLDADVEAVEMDGPFAAGSKGFTVTRSSGRIPWRIASVGPGTSALIEVPIGDAVGRFAWTFTDLGGRTRITQKVSAAGQGAGQLASQMAAIFETNLPAGMRKLCEAMAKSAA